MERKSVSLKLDADIHKRLTDWADSEKRTVASLVERMVEFQLAGKVLPAPDPAFVPTVGQ